MASTSERSAHGRHKLALLAYYLPAFAKLCTDLAGGWYYIDGFAGNGANRAGGFPPNKGTALIGLTQPLPPTFSILVEKLEAEAAILQRRADATGTPHRVLIGDANELLPGALRELPNRRLPAFCTLDPWGLELDWSTVEACAANRLDSPYPYELLIYFSTPGAVRAGAVKAPEYAARNAARFNRLFGNEGWQSIAEDQRQGRLSSRDAGAQYLELYKSQLEGLGYSAVLDRPAIGEERGLIYHLVFATNNARGEGIMRSALKRAYAGQMPFQL